MSQDYALLSRRGRFLLHRETWAFLGGMVFAGLVFWMHGQQSADYQYYQRAITMTEAVQRSTEAVQSEVQHVQQDLKRMQAQIPERTKWVKPRWGKQ